MADEKTNPTPKVAARDTMHSNPNTPDRSQMSAEELKEEREKTAPPSNDSVGSEKPGRMVVGSSKPDKDPKQPAGTLVQDLPPLDPGESDVVNKGNPAPEGPLGVQPTEDPLTTTTSKQFGEKGRTKAASKGSSSKTATRSAKTGEKAESKSGKSEDKS